MSGGVVSMICSSCETRLEWPEIRAGRCVQCQTLDLALELPSELAACLKDVDALELIEHPELWPAP